MQKLEKKSLVSFIHIGQPPPMTMQAKVRYRAAYPAERLVSNRTKDILDFVAAERDKLSEADRASMTICLKADDQLRKWVS